MSDLRAFLTVLFYVTAATVIAATVVWGGICLVYLLTIGAK